MLSTKFLTILALLATSASALSVGNGAHLPQRRHAHKAVVGARSARGSEGAHAGFAAKRDVLPAPRKRGINARRCAPKTTSILPTTSTPSTTSADPAPTESDPAPETTSTSVKTTSAEPTKTKAATTSTSDKPTKTSTSVKQTPTDDGGSSGSADKYTGEGTFYGIGLGSCGITNSGDDKIVAVSHLLYDGFGGYTGSDPNKNPICNKKITAHYQGKSTTVTVVDRCTGCAMWDLDFAPSAFNQLADPSVGRLKGVTWSFV